MRRTFSRVAVIAAIALTGPVAAQGCGASVEDSDDGAADAGDAATPLQCWCGIVFPQGFPSDHPGPGYIKCKSGWICGTPDTHLGSGILGCCEPRDEGIPNCYDTKDDMRGVPDQTPHGLECKYCPDGKLCP